MYYIYGVFLLVYRVELCFSINGQEVTLEFKDCYYSSDMDSIAFSRKLFTKVGQIGKCDEILISAYNLPESEILAVETQAKFAFEEKFGKMGKNVYLVHKKGFSILHKK